MKITNSNRILFIKSPTPGSQRSSFAIIEKLGNKYKTLKNEQLVSINERFKEGKLQASEARALVEQILKHLSPKSKKDFLEANRRLLEHYWETVYIHRDLVDRNSAKNRLKRALEIVNNLPLEATSREALQSAVDKKCNGNKHRVVVSTLNQLLRFVNAPFKLRPAKEVYQEVSSVTADELKKILPHIKDEKIKLFHAAAFATGMRAGELFGARADSVKDDFIFIKSQIDVQGVRRATKNRKNRRAYILKVFKKEVFAWLQIPLEERLLFRKRSISKITRIASKKGINREIKFHDLRHSYVRHLLDIGDSLTRVAKYVGDGLRVTEQFYAGFISSDEEMKHTSKLDS